MTGVTRLGIVLLSVLSVTSGCSQVQKAPEAAANGDLRPATARVDGEPIPSSGELVEFPFTPQQLRTGNPLGMTRRVRTFDRGREDFVEFTVSKSDDEGIAFDVCAVTAEGEPLSAAETTPTQSWEALQTHASFDSGQTRVSTEELECAIGKHKCSVYRTTSHTDVLEESYFAHDLPGLPILYRRIVDGHVVAVMEVVHFQRSAE